MLRTVNETSKLCRDKVNTVLKKLITKISPAKSRSIFNTVVQMNTQDLNKKFVI